MNPTDKDSPLFDLMPKTQAAKLVLNERAQKFARLSMVTSDTLQEEQYLRVKLGEKESYGIPFEYIEEVLFQINPTRVPNTPDYIAGIFNRNGLLLTILNLRSFFKIKAFDNNPQNKLVVVQTQKIAAAILVDNIDGIKQFDPNALESPLATKNAIKARYIMGLHQGITPILNIEMLLLDVLINEYGDSL
ncbi:MAG: purine-binding chemotaxis protein CheW [Legionella sp.]|nr:purine-binding chemotaxis protein CheW [Legionella sp.]